MSTILTPDRRVRVFVSSTLQELAAERQAARDAVTSLRLSPVMFELGSRPHPPRDLYRAYLAQSDVFLGVYWERYGWVAPGEDVSGLEDEWNLAGDLPKLVYIKAPAPDREKRLKEMLDRVRADDRVSYKSFTSSEELAQLVADDLALLLTDRFAAASDRASDDDHSVLRRPRVPVPATRLVGRAQELTDIAELLADPSARLVTVVGPGGIGKTRLALEAVRRREAETTLPRLDGIWFVDLSAVTSRAHVASTIAAAFGVRAEGDRPIVEALADRLAGRRVLVVLDNMEQVVDGGAVVSDLLALVPGLSVLATSRTPLGLRGEREYAVGPLETPAAVELLAERAEEVRQGFTVGADNEDAVAEIVRRLDGIPLALELAAAQLRLLSPQSLLARLSGRLDIAATWVDLPERQRTLRATIDWSYDLLHPDEQALLQQLSVFEGGWSLDGAEAVAGGDVLDRLSALVASSMVSADQSSDVEPRFRMLDTVREYAHTRLHATGDAAAAEAALARYARALCWEAGGHLPTGEGRSWFARLDAELVNLRAVLRRAIERDDAVTAIRVAAPVFPFWWSRSLLREMFELAEQTAELPSASMMPADAKRFLLWCRSTLRVSVGRADEAPPMFDDLIAQAREVGDDLLLAHGLTGLAFTMPYATDAERGRAMLIEALDIFRRNGDRWGVAYALTPLGHMALRDGDLQRAVDLHEESLANARLIDNDHLVAGALNQLAFDAVLRGDVAAARSQLDDAATLFEQIHDQEGVAACVGGYSGVAMAMGRADVAAVLLGAAAHVRASAGLVVWPLLVPLVDGFTDAVRAALGADFDDHWSSGYAIPVSDVLTSARSAVASID